MVSPGSKGLGQCFPFYRGRRPLGFLPTRGAVSARLACAYCPCASVVERFRRTFHPLGNEQTIRHASAACGSSPGASKQLLDSKMFRAAAGSAIATLSPRGCAPAGRRLASRPRRRPIAGLRGGPITSRGSGRAYDWWGTAGLGAPSGAVLDERAAHRGSQRGSPAARERRADRSERKRGSLKIVIDRFLSSPLATLAAHVCVALRDAHAPRHGRSAPSEPSILIRTLNL